LVTKKEGQVWAKGGWNFQNYKNKISFFLEGIGRAELFQLAHSLKFLPNWFPRLKVLTLWGRNPERKDKVWGKKVFTLEKPLVWSGFVVLTKRIPNSEL